MKRMKAKYLIFLCMLLIVGSLTACSSKKDTDTINYSDETAQYLSDMIESYQAQGQVGDDYTADTVVKSQMDSVISYLEENFVNADRSTLEAQVKADEETNAAQASYLEETEDAGAYKADSAYDLTLDMDDEGMEASGYLQFEKRDVKFTVSASTTETSILFEKKLTTGEILKRSGMNTLLGMGTVFLVLILISLVISCFKFVSAPEKKPEVKVEAKNETESNVSSVSAQTVEQEENLTDDLELVAVITAAIAASEGTSADGFRVRSIRRVGNAKWNRV